MRVALHTRIRPGRVTEYEAAHREVPQELAAATSLPVAWTLDGA
ncbi:L-rhamnose mutarotase [Actinomadura sp. HBU206391]|nr:L-rhamnose mutarotase [Actinomadura sp. HBU206391]